MKKRSLKIRLFLLFFCLFAVALIVISAISGYLLTSTVRKQTTAHARQMLEQFDRSVQQDISEYFAMAVLMEQDIKLQRLLRRFYQNSSDYQTRIDLREHLKPYLKQREYIFSIIFLFRNGDMYYDSIPPVYTAEQILDIGWHRDMREKRTRYRLFTGEKRIPFNLYNDYLFAMGYQPDEGSYNSGIELVYFAFAEGTFADIYQEHMNDDVGQLYILDENGTIIGGRSRMEDQLQFKKAWEQGEMQNRGGRFYLDHTRRREVIFSRSDLTGWTLVYVTDNQEMMLNIQRVSFIIILISILSGLLLCGTAYGMIRKIAEPFTQLSVRMKDFCEVLDTDVVIHNVSNRDECEQLERMFEQMSEDIKCLIARQEAIEKERARAEIQALQYQIRPHFMLNTLNAIRSLAITTGADTRVQQMMKSFACVIDECLTDISEYHSLTEERRYLTSYLMLMELRYGERWEAVIDFPDDLSECSIMKYLIQPFVENSIQHGFRMKSHGGVIIIRAESDGGEVLCITVEDNGEGIPKEKRESLLDCTDEKKGEDRIGIRNIQKRICLNYPEQPYGMELVSGTDGTKIILRLPLQCRTGQNERGGMTYLPSTGSR